MINQPMKNSHEGKINRRHSFVGKLSSKTKTIFKAKSWHSGMNALLSRKDSTTVIPDPGSSSHDADTLCFSDIKLFPSTYPPGRVSIQPNPLGTSLAPVGKPKSSGDVAHRPPPLPRQGKVGLRRRNRNTTRGVAPLPVSLTEKAVRCQICGCRLSATSLEHYCRACEAYQGKFEGCVMKMAHVGKTDFSTEVSKVTEERGKENVLPRPTFAPSFVIVRENSNNSWSGPSSSRSQGWLVGDEKEAEEKGLLYETEDGSFREEKVTPAKTDRLPPPDLLFTPSKNTSSPCHQNRSPSQEAKDHERRHSVPPSFGSPLRGLVFAPEPPGQPEPPESVDVTSNSITLQWSENKEDRSSSVTFRLTGRQFGEKEMNVWYEGPEREYCFYDLKAHSIYIFKLEVINENGASPQSAGAAYRTRQQVRQREEIPYDLRAHTFQALTDFRVRQQELFEALPLTCKYDDLMQQFENYRLDKHLAEGLPFDPRAVCRISVSRHSVLEDSLLCFSVLKTRDLLMPLRVEFENEDGIDSGSIVKDWFLKISENLFSLDAGLFITSKQGNYKIRTNFSSAAQEQQPDRLSLFHFFGRLMAKAIMDGHTIGVQLDILVLKFILQEPVDIEDLWYSDEELYQNLVWTLKNDISGTYLGTFSLTLSHGGVVSQADLVEGGSSMDITEDNKQDYVSSLLNWLVYEQSKAEKEAILQGFEDLIPRSFLQKLTSLEFQTVLCGEREINLDIFKHDVQYKGGYDADSDQVRWFWEVVNSMNQEDQRNLVQFCTGSDSLPLKGLNPPLTITRSYMSSLQDLPRSHACFNQIALPEYQTLGDLSTKLHYAISNTCGFHLT